MKQGMDLPALATRIKSDHESERDFVADSRRCKVVVDGSDLRFALDGVDPFAMNDTFHQQLAERLKIPKPYYDRLRSGPAGLQLFADNCNHWLTTDPQPRLIRTIAKTARALLSSSYRPLDNLDLAGAVLPAFAELDLEIVSCNVSDDAFFLKAVTPKLEGEVKVGDVVRGGINIRNSEVGRGGLSVDKFVERLVCTNGMCVGSALWKGHVGRTMAVGEDGVTEFYKDETRAADDKAFFLKVRDTVQHTLSEAGFQETLEKLRAAAGQPIEGKPVKAVEELTKRYELSKGEGDSVLDHLIRGGDLSRWGLANAITRSAADVDSYDRATELEALGGRLIELPKSEWQSLAQAA